MPDKLGSHEPLRIIFFGKTGAGKSTTINIRFRLKHDAVPQLHQTIGPDYVKRMLSPEIGNRAREIFAVGCG